MDAALVTLILNLIATPVLVLLTLWAKARISTQERHDRREDDYFDNLSERVVHLEKEIREVRVGFRELKYFSDFGRC